MSTVIVELEEGAIGVSVPDVSVGVSVPVSVVQVETSGPPGPAGTMILDGEGPPGATAGEAGDYYLDSAGDVLYGPKASEDVQAVDPVSVVGGENFGPLTYGMKYQFNSSGVVHGITVRPTAGSTTLTGWTVQVWNRATQAELGRAVGGPLAPGAYNVIPLPVPVPVVPGTVYIISVSLPADTSRIGQDYTTTAPCASQDIRLVLDGEGSGTTGSYSDGIGSFPVNDVPKYRSPLSPVYGKGTVWPVALDPPGEVAEHEAKPDPHPQYLTAAELSAALPPETDANRNTGYGAGTPVAFNAGAFDNTGVGQGVLGLITTGDRNTGAGSGALAALTTGSNNTVLGYQAGAKLTTGNSNFALGPYALDKATTASDTVAIGYQAMRGIVDVNGGVGIGSYALNLATAGPNVAIGGSALANLSTAYYNTAIGTSAFGALTTGRYNTAVGYLTGGYGVNMGTQEFTVLVGAHTSAYAAGSGNALTAVGFQSKAHTGATALGSYAEARGISSTALGSYAVATLDNQIMLGTAAQRVDVPGAFYVKGSQVWKSWTGTQAAYDAIAVKDSGTLYCVVA